MLSKNLLRMPNSHKAVVKSRLPHTLLSGSSRKLVHDLLPGASHMTILLVVSKFVKSISTDQLSIRLGSNQTVVGRVRVPPGALSFTTLRPGEAYRFRISPELPLSLKVAAPM